MVQNDRMLIYYGAALVHYGEMLFERGKTSIQYDETSYQVIKAGCYYLETVGNFHG